MGTERRSMFWNWYRCKKWEVRVFISSVLPSSSLVGFNAKPIVIHLLVDANVLFEKRIPKVNSWDEHTMPDSAHTSNQLEYTSIKRLYSSLRLSSAKINHQNNSTHVSECYFR
jgi:hypothetical protein